MSFADSLNRDEIERQKREKERQEREDAIQKMVSWFERDIQRRCIAIANNGGHSVSGYVANEAGDYGFSEVIVDFPSGSTHIPQAPWGGIYMKHFPNKEDVDRMCAGMSRVLIDLGFTRFRISAQSVQIPLTEYYSVWYSTKRKSRISGYKEEFAIYVDLNW